MSVIIYVVIALAALVAVLSASYVVRSRARIQREKERGMHQELNREMENRLGRFGPAAHA